MAFVRTKTIKGNDYLYLVESYREGGQVKQRVLEYLGPVGQVSMSDVSERYRGDVERMSKMNETNQTKTGLELWIEVDGETYKPSDAPDFKDTDTQSDVALRINNEQYRVGDIVSLTHVNDLGRGQSSDSTYRNVKITRIDTGTGVVNGSLFFDDGSDWERDIHYLDSLTEIEKEPSKETRVIQRPGDNFLAHGGETYKIYNYEEGDAVFVEDEKTAVDELIAEEN